MNPTMLDGFQDELEKISSFMRDVGNNVGNTLKGFTTPVQSVKKGWQYSGWSQAGDARSALGAGKKISDMEKGWAAGKGIGKRLPGNKALTIGFGALQLPAALKKEDPSGGGKSRAERLSRVAGNTLGGIIGTPYGISGSVVGGIAGDIVGGVVGKGVDKIRGRKKKPKPLTHEPELPEPAQARLTGPQVE